MFGIENCVFEVKFFNKVRMVFLEGFGEFGVGFGGLSEEEVFRDGICLFVLVVFWNKVVFDWLIFWLVVGVRGLLIGCCLGVGGCC